MNPLNKAAFQELIGDTRPGNTNTCVNGSNSLNGTPNCLYKNFNTPSEKVSTAQTDYSAAMFEAFKYFGGYTNPANADTNLAGSPLSASQYGPQRYASGSTGPDLKSDRFAFTDFATLGTTSTNRLVYDMSVDNTTLGNRISSCAKNYIVFILL